MEASRRAALKKRKRNWRLRRTQFCQKPGGGHIFISSQMFKTGTKRETSCSLPFWSGFTSQFVPPIFGTHHVRTHEWGCSGRYCVNKTTQHLCERVAFVPPRSLSSCAAARRRRETGANDDASWVFLFTAVYGRGREGERKRRERRSRIRGVYQISYGPRAVLGSNDRWNRGSAR